MYAIYNIEVGDHRTVVIFVIMLSICIIVVDWSSSSTGPLLFVFTILFFG